MKTRSKRFKEQLKKVDKTKQYPLEDALKLVKELASAKFDETVEVALGLGVDPRKADQNVRGSVPLPYGLGKKIRVIVFAKGDKAKEALDAGADFVGSDDLVEKIREGWQEFDSVVATPDMMVQVGKIGKILGPRGLMPSPKVGTVTFDVKETVVAIKAGRVEFRVDKAGIIHAPVGKASFSAENLSGNINALITAINRFKPSTSKGVYLQNGAISLTMSPGIKLDVVPLRIS
jgi:large subunit ribosomal protein L1